MDFQSNENIDRPTLSGQPVRTIYRSMQGIVFDTIRDEVLSGSLKPGEVLNTIELSRRLGVSRTPIREALNRLVSIGLVGNETHRGFFVAKLSVDQLLEIYFIRGVVSGACSRLSIRNLTNQQKHTLEQLCDAMESSIAADDHKRMLELNYQFHMTIIRAANSPRLEELVIQYYGMTEQYRALGLELPGRYEEICREHRSILNAIMNGDEQDVELQEREHQFNTARRIAESMGITPNI